MCGINGQIALTRNAVVDAWAGRRVRDAMAARGPDGAGEWMSPTHKAWLGHRRLAIVDLSATGAQPMESGDGRFILTFNGEIYNHAALRAELTSKGHRFYGTSDSETLLHLFLEEGPDCVRRLEGMFAFAIFDERDGTVFAARDPFGIKPLYYAVHRGILSFASQVKALLEDERIPRAPDMAGLTGFAMLGSVPEPFTTHEAISAVPAGHMLEAGPETPLKLTRYHDVSAVFRNAAETVRPTTPDAIDDYVRVHLGASVARHLASDVPVGAFLSAGIDSGALVGLMRDAGAAQITTVTLGYDEFAGDARDETPLAGEVARHYGTHHVEARIGAKAFREDFDRFLAAMDQPSVDGLNTWFVSKTARAAGLKVAISGIGGDELFAGYGSFRRVPRLRRIAALLAPLRSLAPVADAVAAACRTMGAPIHPKAAGILGEAATFEGAYLLSRCVFRASEVGELFADRKSVREGLERLAMDAMLARAIEGLAGQDAARVAALEIQFYLRNQLLRDSDWAGMAHSLEIRTPLVDRTLFEALAPLLLADTGHDMKRCLSRAPRRALPKAVAERRKTGFAIPVERWIDGDLRPSRGTGENFARRWTRSLLAERLDPSMPAKTMARTTHGGEREPQDFRHGHSPHHDDAEART